MARELALSPSSKSQSPSSQRLSPLARLRAEMDQWFDDFPARLPLSQFGQIRFPMAPPAIDMTETEDSYQLSAEVPGIDIEDVEISVAEGMLKIAGEKRDEREEKERDYSYSERSYGRFEREIALPPDADAENIKAKVKKGVLKITVPKDKDAGGRKQRIPIEAE